jgi:hypothetical protein
LEGTIHVCVVVTFDGASKVIRQSFPTFVTVVPDALPTSCMHDPSPAVTKVAFADGIKLGTSETTVKNGRISDAITTLRTRIPHGFKSTLGI